MRPSIVGFAVVSSLASLFTMSTAAQVLDIYRINDGAFDNHVEYYPIELAPGKEWVLGDLTDPGEVTYLHYTDAKAARGAMYSGLILQVYWDNAADPSMRLPLWNFFDPAKTR